jgi:hypothetical protein
MSYHEFYTYECNSYPHYATGVVSGNSIQNSDDLQFSQNDYIDEQNGIKNPLVFTGKDSWPVSAS